LRLKAPGEMIKLRINCREAHELLSRQHDTALHWSERLALHLHLRVCDWCRTVQRNLAFLSRAVRRLDY